MVDQIYYKNDSVDKSDALFNNIANKYGLQ